MEMLVVLGLFSMVVAAASDIFLITNRSMQKIFTLERAQADARFALEAMVREIRSDSLDFAAYGGDIPVGTGILRLRDDSDQAIVFRRSNDDESGLCRDNDADAPCLLVSAGGSATVPVTPRGVVVNNLRFFISPARDPFVMDPVTGKYGNNLQPRVTIVMTVTASTGRLSDLSVINLQTTAASRIYKR